MGRNPMLVREVLDYLWTNKAWWLAPALITLLIVGALLAAGQSSALSPFVYAMI